MQGQGRDDIPALGVKQPDPSRSTQKTERNKENSELKIAFFYKNITKNAKKFAKCNKFYYLCPHKTETKPKYYYY